jgi:hypothetical protein
MSGDHEMPLRYLENVRPKSRLAIWAWGPVIVLRFAVVSTYLGLVYASVIAFIAGVPIFELTTPQGWQPVWAVTLGTSAVIASIGSLSDKWQKLEMFAVAVVGAMMLAYVGGLNLRGFVDGDLDRQFIGVIAFIAAILPWTRFIYLAAQMGKRKHVLPSTT